jgi:hypothetical protein
VPPFVERDGHGQHFAVEVVLTDVADHDVDEFAVHGLDQDPGDGNAFGVRSLRVRAELGLAAPQRAAEQLQLIDAADRVVTWLVEDRVRGFGDGARA